MSTLGVLDYPANGIDSDTTLLVAQNNAPSTSGGAVLNASISNSAATITATGASEFPAANSSISCENETIYYATASTVGGVTTFSGCLRGQDGTTQAAHGSGTAISHDVIAAHHELLKKAVVAIQTKIGWGGGGSPTASGQFLKSTGLATSDWLALTSSDVTTALGYTPVASANGSADALTATGVFTTTGVARLEEKVVIGATIADSGAGLYVNPSTILAGLAQYGVHIAPTFQSDANNSGDGLYINLATAAAAYTMAAMSGLRVGDATLGAGSAITTLYGLRIESLTKGATNYGVYVVGNQSYFKNKTTTEIPLIVDTVAGQTGKLQSWRVAGAEQAYISANGDFGGLTHLFFQTTDPSPVTNGQLWYSTSPEALSISQAMGIKRLSGVLYVAPASSTLSAATILTTETAFSTSFTIPANTLVAGKGLRISIDGIATVTSSGPTLLIKLRFTNGATHIVLLSTGSQTSMFGTTALSNLPWTLDAQLTVQAAGVSGSVVAGGTFAASNSATFTQSSPKTLGGAAVTVDTTAAQTIEVTVTYSVGTAGNTITVQQMWVELVD